MQEVIEWLGHCSQTVLTGLALAALDPLSECMFDKVGDWLAHHDASIDVFREYYRKSLARGLQTITVAFKGPSWYSSRLNKDFARNFESEVCIPFASKYGLSLQDFRERVIVVCEKLKREDFLERLFGEEHLLEQDIESVLSGKERDLASVLSPALLTRMSEWIGVGQEEPAFRFLFQDGYLARAVEINLRESFLSDDRFRNALVYSDRKQRSEHFREMDAKISGLRDEIFQATQKQDFQKVIDLSIYSKEFTENLQKSRSFWERVEKTLEARESQLECLREQLGSELLDALEDLHTLVSEERQLPPTEVGGLQGNLRAPTLAG